MNGTFHVKAKEPKPIHCLLKEQGPKLLSGTRAQNWNNSMKTSVRVLSDPRSLPGNVAQFHQVKKKKKKESNKTVREEWRFDSLFKNMFNKTSPNCGHSYKKNNS